MFSDYVRAAPGTTGFHYNVYFLDTLSHFDSLGYFFSPLFGHTVTVLLLYHRWRIMRKKEHCHGMSEERAEEV